MGKLDQALGSALAAKDQHNHVGKVCRKAWSSTIRGELSIFLTSKAAQPECEMLCWDGGETRPVIIAGGFTVRSLQLHLFCFSQRKRDDLFTVQKCLNVLKILVTRNLYNISEKDENWL